MTTDFIFRLLAAFACGVVIGLERQIRQRTAGLRTFTLVSSGACLFVTLGVQTGSGISGVTQIAAYVVSGVGFLGGGVIMRDSGSIQGINTAATLWCSAAVGVLSGSGHYGPAAAGTAAVLASNTLLRMLSQLINASSVDSSDLVREYQITVIARSPDEVHIRVLLSNAMTLRPLAFKSLTSEDVEDRAQTVRVTATLTSHPKYQGRLERIASRISMEKGVSGVTLAAKDAQSSPD